ncbi:MAG: acetyl-CoA carboxylase biotin carboxyl carrier protein [Treponema sp.]|nr:acetyl-CoA carboxylase biotin carboxyl carrier protein [Treponema sp.]
MDDKFFLTMVDKFNSSDIVEMDFNDGNVRLLLRKDCAYKQSISAENIIPAVRLGMPAANTDVNNASGEKIKSPIVGTFYSSPSPDSPPFVKIDSKIKKGQTLCILEAMKMMNHLEAEFYCEIIEVHASSGELVEFGQELFTVKRS